MTQDTPHTAVDEPVTDYDTETDSYPEGWIDQERWFTFKVTDNGRKIPRAPYHNTDWPDKYEGWDNTEMWTSFETATEWADKLSGHGLASCIPEVEDNDEFRPILFDFDNCRCPETGAIHPQAWRFIHRYELYAAISTSGTGIHAYGIGRLPEGYKPSFDTEMEPWPGGRPDALDAYVEAKHDDPEPDAYEPSFEMYASARFVAMTGRQITGTYRGMRDVSELMAEMVPALGAEKTPAEEREPDKSREDLDTVEVTADIQDVYDAIAHVRPDDIHVDSPVTEERADGVLSRNPTWTTSQSGTRLAEFDDHWLYRKGNHRLDALQVVALEEGIIGDVTEYPRGKDFFDAVRELRARGAHIPELIGDENPEDVDEGAASEPEPQADGGHEGDVEDFTDAPEPPEPEPQADVHQDPSDAINADAAGNGKGNGGGGGVEPTVPDPIDWQTIEALYSVAEDADETDGARHQAATTLLSARDYLTNAETDVLYAFDYDRGWYRANGEADVRGRLADGLGRWYSNHEKREVLEKVKARTFAEPADIGGEPWRVPCVNGTIDLEAYLRDDVDRPVLQPHDPSDRFLAGLQVEYDPQATADRFEQFLREVVPSENDREKLQQYAGYCLYHWDVPYHKALFLVGPTASGKSTFLDAVRGLFAPDAVSNVTPQELTGERFAGVQLFGTWLNVRNDIPSGLIENTGKWKEIVGGDPIKVEEKMQPTFTIEPRAKHMYSANQLPDAKVEDEAFYRRVMLVLFPHTVPEERRDKQLDEKLQAEAPGILNWALEGLETIIESGGFVGARSPKGVRDTWEEWGSPAERFKADALEEAKGETTRKDEMYDAFKAYCEAKGLPPMSKTQFGQSMKGEGVTDSRASGGDRPMVWDDLRIRDEWHPTNLDVDDAPESGSLA